MLSDEDKKWLDERLERFVETFDLRLERLEATFTERIQRLDESFSERLERVEARLLTEFHKWASPVELRARSHAAAVKALDAEMEALADRVTNIENRTS